MPATYLFDPVLFLAGCEAAQAEYIQAIREEDPGYLSQAQEVVAQARTMKPLTLELAKDDIPADSKTR